MSTLLIRLIALDIYYLYTMDKIINPDFYKKFYSIEEKRLRERIYKRRYRLKYKKREKLRSREASRNHTKNITDKYLKDLIRRRNKSIKTQDITSEMIEIKRKQLKLYRHVKEKTK